MADAELTPEQEDDIRRLLVEARHAEPLPAEIGQRLDRVLDQLRDGVDLAPVVTLASRRHRRRQATQLLVAAAAVIALGFGVAHISTHGSGGGTNSDAAGSSTSSGRQGQSAASSPAQDLASATESVPSAKASVAPTSPQGLQAALPLRLRDHRFGHDVREAVRTARTFGATTSAPSGSSGSVDSLDGVGSCAASSYGTGTLIPVVYRGVPSVLAVRSQQAGELTVQVLGCGTATVLRSAIVPAR